MKPSFLLFHAENVNDNQDSICHLILIPVINGEQQQPHEFFLNPEAPFQCVMSGISSSEVDSFDAYSVKWPEIQSIFNQFEIAVCSAEGYSAKALYGTLSRLGIEFGSIRYCNAKAICRRTLNELSYSFNYLCYRFQNDCVYSDEPASIALRWSEFVLLGLSPLADETLQSFLTRVKINIGTISINEFVPSLCQRDYSKRREQSFKPSNITVESDPGNPFFGMNVVFTGKMESIKRDDARAAVVKIGGNAPDGITKETDYLVVGAQDIRRVGEKGLSGKMKTAEKYRKSGIPIEMIDEAEFIEMIGKENLPFGLSLDFIRRFMNKD